MITDREIGQETQDKALTALRVTPGTIESSIHSEYYFTAAQAVEQLGPSLDRDSPLRLFTFCVLVLRNGFIVTGESACVPPENTGMGRKIARQHAVDKIWALEGYALKDRLARARS